MNIKENSNTSHVIVYHNYAAVICQTSQIQIHLMLLFIKIVNALVVVLTIFKYISCYCLSPAEG